MLAQEANGVGTTDASVIDIGPHAKRKPNFAFRVGCLHNLLSRPVKTHHHVGNGVAVLVQDPYIDVGGT